MDNNISINSETIETIISAQTRFVGSVNTEKPIRIDGYFEGEIVSTSDVIISECGKFKGSIKCRIMNLVGTGEGTLVCSELLDVTETGKFVVDITTNDLVTVKGSKLSGTCQVG